MKHRQFVPPSKRRKQKSILLKCIALLMVFVVLVIIADHKIYPLIKDFAQAQAEIFANNTINDAVAEYLNEEDIQYSDLILLTKNTYGSVNSIEANTVGINKIKVSIIDKVREKINATDQSVLGIPLGNLTGSSYLAGRGPELDVKLKMSSNVSAVFESSFTSAGINQTLHTINLKVTADVYIMLPYGRSDATFTTDYLIGQTVIAGDVPDAYTYVNEIGGTGDTDNLIMDYGAANQKN